MARELCCEFLVVNRDSYLKKFTLTTFSHLVSFYASFKVDGIKSTGVARDSSLRTRFITNATKIRENASFAWKAQYSSSGLFHTVRLERTNLAQTSSFFEISNIAKITSQNVWRHVESFCVNSWRITYSIHIPKQWKETQSHSRVMAWRTAHEYRSGWQENQKSALVPGIVPFLEHEIFENPLNPCNQTVLWINENISNTKM